MYTPSSNIFFELWWVGAEILGLALFFIARKISKTPIETFMAIQNIAIIKDYQNCMTIFRNIVKKTKSREQLADVLYFVSLVCLIASTITVVLRSSHF